MLQEALGDFSNHHHSPVISVGHDTESSTLRTYVILSNCAKQPRVVAHTEEMGDVRMISPDLCKMDLKQDLCENGFASALALQSYVHIFVSSITWSGPLKQWKYMAR